MPSAASRMKQTLNTLLFPNRANATQPPASYTGQEDVGTGGTIAVRYYGPLNASGRPHGLGVMVDGTSQYYEGYFRNGKRDGYGVRHYSDGDTLYEGWWRDGQPHGVGVRYNGNGTRRHEGQWSNGQPLPGAAAPADVAPPAEFVAWREAGGISGWYARGGTRLATAVDGSHQNPHNNSSIGSRRDRGESAYDASGGSSDYERRPRRLRPEQQQQQQQQRQHQQQQQQQPQPQLQQLQLFLQAHQNSGNNDGDVPPPQWFHNAIAPAAAQEQQGEFEPEVFIDPATLPGDITLEDALEYTREAHQLYRDICTGTTPNGQPLPPGWELVPGQLDDGSDSMYLDHLGRDAYVNVEPFAVFMEAYGGGAPDWDAVRTGGGLSAAVVE